MNIEFDLKEYLGMRFDAIDNRLDKIETDLSDHRKTEKEISIEMTKLKTHAKWIIGIGSIIATALIKQFFFT